MREQDNNTNGLPEENLAERYFRPDELAGADRYDITDNSRSSDDKFSFTDEDPELVPLMPEDTQALEKEPESANSPASDIKLMPEINQIHKRRRESRAAAAYSTAAKARVAHPSIIRNYDEEATTQHRFCPYCGAELTPVDCAPYFRNSVGIDTMWSYGAGSDFYNRAISKEEKTNYRECTSGAQLYQLYWRTYIGGNAPIGNVPGGVYLIDDVMERLERSEGNLEVTLDCKKENNYYHRATIRQPGTGRFDSDGIACKYCGQFLPSEFWKYDCVGISLYGSQQTGKTVYMVALLAGNCANLMKSTNIDNSGYTLEASVLNVGFGAGIHEQFMTACEEWSKGSLPSSSTMYLPPVFVKLKWNFDNRPPYEHIVYFSDQAGEFASDRNRNADSMVRGSYGSLYFVCPEQFDVVKKGMSASDAVHQRNAAAEFGVADDTSVPSKDMLVSGDKPNNSSGFNDAAGKTNGNANAGPLDVYTSIEMRAGSHVEKKICALVMTKIGRFLNKNGYVTADIQKRFSEEVVNKELLFRERMNMVYDSDVLPFYHEAVNSLFNFVDPYSHLNRLRGTFSPVKRFVCQAFRDEPKIEEGKKILKDQDSVHLADPVIWILHHYLVKKGIL